METVSLSLSVYLYAIFEFYIHRLTCNVCFSRPSIYLTSCFALLVFSTHVLHFMSFSIFSHSCASFTRLQEAQQYILSNYYECLCCCRCISISPAVRVCVVCKNRMFCRCSKRNRYFLFENVCLWANNVYLNIQRIAVNEVPFWMLWDNCININILEGRRSSERERDGVECVFEVIELDSVARRSINEKNRISHAQK